MKKHQVTCPICLDRYTDLSGQEPSTPPILALLTKCGHHFHFPCVWRWLDNNPTCPVCRRKLEISDTEIKAVTLREIHNREVDNKSEVSSVYVIDKGSLGDTMITMSDTFSDSGSYYSTHTNSNPRRHTTRAVTVSPRSVHISPRLVSSPTSTLSSNADNHSMASTQDSPQDGHSRNGSHGTYHSRNASNSTSHSRHGSQGGSQSHSRHSSQSGIQTHSRHGSEGQPLIHNLQDEAQNDPSEEQNDACNQTETQVTIPKEESEPNQVSSRHGSTSSSQSESDDGGQRNRALTPVADDNHVIHM